jgi:CP12 domain
MAFCIPLTIPIVPKPTKNKIKTKDVQRAIEHAKLICFNFEDTPECRIAWDEVEELSKALNRQTVRERRTKRFADDSILDEARRIALIQREYDI